MRRVESCSPVSRLRSARQQGLTLVELVVTIVVLAIALTAMSGFISTGIQRSPDILLQTQALVLAQSYTDEILSKRFDENAPVNGIPPCHAAGTPCTADALLGPEAGEARAAYDDVDDYHGLHEGYGAPGAVPLQDIDGLARVGYDNFGIGISVRYLDATESGLGIAQIDAKLISLTVTHSTNPEGWQFGVYKVNF